MVPLGSNPTGYIAPPKLKRDADKIRWREDIGFWRQNVSAESHAGEINSAGVAAALSLTLYLSFD